MSQDFRAFRAAKRAAEPPPPPIQSLDGKLYLVPEGWYNLNCHAPCGTRGLGTCVGIAISHTGGQAGGPWFVAHVDSKCKPTTEAEQKAVIDFVSTRLKTVLEGLKVTDAFVFNPRAFREDVHDDTNCIIRGVKEWYKGAMGAELPRHRLIAGHGGFYMTPAGSFVPIVGEEDDLQAYQDWKKGVYKAAKAEERAKALGIGDFTVPAHP